MAPENLGLKVLKSLSYETILTLNFITLSDVNIYDEKYFPRDVMKHSWMMNKENVNKLA